MAAFRERVVQHCCWEVPRPSPTVCDSLIGHRNFSAWRDRTNRYWTQDRTFHNSHLVVIRKRSSPAPAFRINLHRVAMDGRYPCGTGIPHGGVQATGVPIPHLAQQRPLA